MYSTNNIGNMSNNTYDIFRYPINDAKDNFFFLFV